MPVTQQQLFRANVVKKYGNYNNMSNNNGVATRQQKAVLKKYPFVQQQYDALVVPSTITARDLRERYKYHCGDVKRVKAMLEMNHNPQQQQQAAHVATKRGIGYKFKKGLQKRLVGSGIRMLTGAKKKAEQITAGGDDSTKHARIVPKSSKKKTAMKKKFGMLSAKKKKKSKGDAAAAANNEIKSGLLQVETSPVKQTAGKDDESMAKNDVKGSNNNEETDQVKKLEYNNIRSESPTAKSLASTAPPTPDRSSILPYLDDGDYYQGGVLEHSPKNKKEAMGCWACFSFCQ